MQPHYDRSKAKLIAEEYRRKGYMYSEIAVLTGYSKSTIHGWLSDLQLTDLQQTSVNDRLVKDKQKRIGGLLAARQEKIQSRHKSITKLAQEVASSTKLSKSHKQLICSIFFWCEGGKDTRAGFQFINSDPLMIETFLNLLRDSFDIDESKFRALVHLHDYHDPEVQLKYWSDTTKIPLSQFHKPYLKPHTGKNTRKGYPGCVSIRYLDRQFGLLLQMLYTSFGNTHRGIVHRLVYSSPKAKR